MVSHLSTLSLVDRTKSHVFGRLLASFFLQLDCLSDTIALKTAVKQLTIKFRIIGANPAVCTLKLVLLNGVLICHVFHTVSMFYKVIIV